MDLDSSDGLRQVSFTVKIYYFIPLGLALAGLAFWSFSQRQAAADLASQSQALQRKISTAQQTTTASQAPTEKLKTAGQPLDWKNLGTRLVAAQQQENSTTDAALEGLNQRVAQMTAPELLAALDEISALSLQPDATAALEEMLAEVLILRDPAAALGKFSDRIQDESDGVGWQLASALGEWAKRDLTAATAWFDREITAGRFESKSLDGQSEARLEFEAALLGQLLSTAPKAAAARLAALPEGERRTALEQMDTTKMSSSSQQTYMDLLRQLVPQAERGDALSYLISEVITGGDCLQVAEFLNTVQATPEERTVATRSAAGTQLETIASERAVTHSDLETLRTWLKQQAPTAVDRLTGEALAQAIQDDGEFSYAHAAALVSDYHQSSGNDDIITGFLAGEIPVEFMPQAQALAARITDPKRKEQVFGHLK
jgi:hypothetical protein